MKKYIIRSKDGKLFEAKYLSEKYSKEFYDLQCRLYKEGLPDFRNKQTYKEILNFIKGAEMEIKKRVRISLVLFDGKKAIAHINISRWSKDGITGDLYIYIDKEYRNRGVGKALINLILGLAKKDKYETVALEVDSNNKIAIRLYKKMGFVVFGVLPKAYKLNEKYYNDVFMYKKI